MTNPCVFCGIVAGSEPASLVAETDSLLAFKGIRPVHAAYIMRLAMHLGRTVRASFECERIGMVVHTAWPTRT